MIVALAVAASCRKPPAAQSNTAATSGTTAKPAQAPDTPPAPPKPMPVLLPDVLARVNGEAVTKTDFDRLVRNIEIGNGPIPAERRDQVLRNLLDQLITYTVMTQEAKAKNVTVTDGEIDERIKQMRGPASDADFQKALEARNMSAEQLRTDAKVQLTIEKMMEAQVADVGTATDAEARDFYQKNPEKFKQGDSVRASHILLRIDPNAPEPTKKQARTRIAGLLKRARSGENFAALAKQHSQDGSAQQGGDLGYFEKGEMVPAFSETAFSLKPGQISDVVTTQFGYHILKVTDRKPATTVPFEQVSRQIVEFLSSQKKQDRATQFVDEAKKRARIEVLI
ncbi:MAG: peptidylprolyl isomerase [Vicinamibacterales bacterium]